jgi:hypothetical protein
LFTEVFEESRADADREFFLHFPDLAYVWLRSRTRSLVHLPSDFWDPSILARGSKYRKSAKPALCEDGTFRQHLLDAAEGLAGAFFVFDEGEADVVVAVAAEADAGRDGGFDL